MRKTISKIVEEEGELDTVLQIKFRIILMLCIIVGILDLWFIADMLGM